MNENEKADKLKEIFSDEEFVAKVFAIETAEEVQNAIKEKGVELTIEQLKEIQNAMLAQENNEEINDKDLEKVAGGFSNLSAVYLLKNPNVQDFLKNNHNNQKRLW